MARHLVSGSHTGTAMSLALRMHKDLDSLHEGLLAITDEVAKACCTDLPHCGELGTVCHVKVYRLAEDSVGSVASDSALIRSWHCMASRRTRRKSVP